MLQKQNPISYRVSLEDQEGNVVATQSTAEGTLSVPNAKLWWPFSMVTKDSDAGYLYTLVVCVMEDSKSYVQSC